jgi:hypothetical protein
MLIMMTIEVEVSGLMLNFAFSIVVNYFVKSHWNNIVNLVSKSQPSPSIGAPSTDSELLNFCENVDYMTRRANDLELGEFLRAIFVFEESDDKAPATGIASKKLDSSGSKKSDSSSNKSAGTLFLLYEFLRFANLDFARKYFSGKGGTSGAGDDDDPPASCVFGCNQYEERRRSKMALVKQDGKEKGGANSEEEKETIKDAIISSSSFDWSSLDNSIFQPKMPWCSLIRAFLAAFFFGSTTTSTNSPNTNFSAARIPPPFSPTFSSIILPDCCLFPLRLYLQAQNYLCSPSPAIKLFCSQVNGLSLTKLGGLLDAYESEPVLLLIKGRNEGESESEESEEEDTDRPKLRSPKTVLFGAFASHGFQSYPNGAYHELGFGNFLFGFDTMVEETSSESNSKKPKSQTSREPASHSTEAAAKETDSTEPAEPDSTAISLTEVKQTTTTTLTHHHLALHHHHRLLVRNLTPSKSNSSQKFTYLNYAQGSHNYHPKGVAFGGSSSMPRLWIDESFKGHVLMSDSTYEEGHLWGTQVTEVQNQRLIEEERRRVDDSSANSSSKPPPSLPFQLHFTVLTLEVFGLGGRSAYHQFEKNLESKKRLKEEMRKVDRRAFAESTFDREMFFGNTFAEANKADGRAT